MAHRVDRESVVLECVCVGLRSIDHFQVVNAFGRAGFTMHLVSMVHCYMVHWMNNAAKKNNISN